MPIVLLNDLCESRRAAFGMEWREGVWFGGLE